MTTGMRWAMRPHLLAAFLCAAFTAPLSAQVIFGGITGTVKDASGSVVADATVEARSVETNLKVDAHTQANGSYSLPNLPAGTYVVTITKTGFDTETHTGVTVQADRTATVNADLKIGAVATTVQVTADNLMNQVDTTNGYVVDQLTIENTPLGTGSFTQLAIMTPGIQADFLGGGGRMPAWATRRFTPTGSARRATASR